MESYVGLLSKYARSYLSTVRHCTIKVFYSVNTVSVLYSISYTCR